MLAQTLPVRDHPAGAGSTSRSTTARCSSSDHPHGAGSTLGSPSTTLIMNGSSPRARGANAVQRRCHPDVRIIPASAESTWSSSPGSSPVCGSSPRARGARRARIPCPRSLPDHPRGRGEHFSAKNASGSVSGSSPPARGARGGLTVAERRAGSSPRARGAHRTADHEHGRVRIIPAGAGSTIHSSRIRPSWADHPRGRGEHAAHSASGTGVIGSSPRARGARAVSATPAADLRIIPAGAGSAALVFHHAISDADHPRGRGEHTYSFRSGSVTTGSSPRARGARSAGL